MKNELTLEQRFEIDFRFWMDLRNNDLDVVAFETYCNYDIKEVNELLNKRMHLSSIEAKVLTSALLQHQEDEEYIKLEAKEMKKYSGSILTLTIFLVTMFLLSILKQM